MKHLLTLSFVLLTIAQTLSQKDTTIHQVTREPFEPPTFADASDYVFMKQVPTPHLFKIGLFNPSNNRSAQGLNIDQGRTLRVDYEQKLGQAFSINASLDFALESLITLDFGEGNTINSDDFRFNQIGISLEPRYYLGMKHKIEKGLQADNLSGQYIGFAVRYFGVQGLEDNYKAGDISTWFSNNAWPNQDGFEANFVFGIQRRILKYGYLDFQLGIGAIHQQIISYSRTGENLLVPAAETSWSPQITTPPTLPMA